MATHSVTLAIFRNISAIPHRAFSTRSLTAKSPENRRFSYYGGVPQRPAALVAEFFAVQQLLAYLAAQNLAEHRPGQVVHRHNLARHLITGHARITVFRAAHVHHRLVRSRLFFMCG